MRQHLLNGWLVAALVATTCLLGVTAYAEVKEDISRGACTHGEQAPGEQGARCDSCGAARCDVRASGA
ncbi:hypothetical protein [Mesorhizobium sp. M7A.F.Ca.MR.148.00.0.0]|uniref:hypothetical protein n=1 Tax=Mesorhizobium sp. M7A.F.Ca.MR.148.00.0.0 TaxID=2496775 RepID=UPI000FCCD997|nr:hypothetical protein [Mesorhizobium sp. M7A.F.Ca.MR.148.00.0.0]RUV33538.1 hypothetical protein EOB49_30025 [Mesorhizobium sp. M7A.F.Ca.MR.148.00.0.0]